MAVPRIIRRQLLPVCSYLFLRIRYVHDICTNIIDTIIRPRVNDFHPGAVFVQEKKPFPPGISAKRNTEHPPMGTLRFIIAWKTKKNAKPAKSNIQRNLSGISRQFVRSNTLFQYSIPILYSSTLFRYSIPVLYSGPRVIKDAVAALPVTRVQDTNVQFPRIQAANGNIIPWLTPG